MIALVESISPADREHNVAECLLCVFRCHQHRVEPVSGGQQLVHRPDAYEHLIMLLLPLHSNPLYFYLDLSIAMTICNTGFTRQV